jgi:hypothetical protein
MGRKRPGILEKNLEFGIRNAEVGIEKNGEVGMRNAEWKRMRKWEGGMTEIRS